MTARKAKGRAGMFHVKHGSKYGSRKTIVDGIAFDSAKEARRYIVLRSLERIGEIEGLELQPRFTLIPAQREPSTFTRTGREKPGKVIERAVEYVADFSYVRDGERVVEDVKGMRTKDYVLKRKMMLWIHGIRIKEI